MANPEIINELRKIAARNGDCLKPEDVIRAAASKRSPLHDCFEWDDTAAGHQWRLHQARNLIRVTVSVIDDGKGKSPVRVFVSLTPDRAGGNGYRPMVAVLSDADMRQQLLSDACEEMEGFQRKYAKLEELGSVFAAMATTARRIAARPWQASAAD